MYFGVLELNRPAHNYRGWLLHFNGALTQTKIPGGFGWDITASIVPVAAVPAYTGTSAYLIMTKYNNYGGAGTGDGMNRMAILDPGQSATRPDLGKPDHGGSADSAVANTGPRLRRWREGMVRQYGRGGSTLHVSVLVNNEDGQMYRWNLATNTLSEQIRFTNGLGESYTPTAFGPDGTLYAINNAVMFAVGR